MAKKKNKEIKEATDAYEVLTGDDEIKRIAEIRLMSELEEQSALATARAKGNEEGLKQGKEEGLKQGKEEIARKLIEQNVDISIISNVTGLPIEEIRNLK